MTFTEILKWIAIGLAIGFPILLLTATLVRNGRQQRGGQQQNQQQGGGNQNQGGQQAPQGGGQPAQGWRGRLSNINFSSTWVLWIIAVATILIALLLLIPGAPSLVMSHPRVAIGTVLGLAALGFLTWVRTQLPVVPPAAGAQRQRRQYEGLVSLLAIVIAVAIGLNLLFSFSNTDGFKKWVERKKLEAEKLRIATAETLPEAPSYSGVKNKEVKAPVGKWSEQVVIPGRPASILFRNLDSQIDGPVEVINFQGERRIFPPGDIIIGSDEYSFLCGSGLSSRVLRFKSLSNREIPLIVEWEY